MAAYTPPPWERPPTPPPTQPCRHIPPPRLHSLPQNLQSVPPNIQLIPPHLQYESPRHQLKYQKVQLPPPNLQLPPPNLQLPPPSLQLPLPNLQLPPPNLQLPPPNLTLSPPTLKKIPPNIKLPFPNLKVLPPTHKMSLPNLEVPPPTRKMSLPNLNLPPPTCMVSPLNLKVLPPTCTMSHPNLKMPSLAHKMSPSTLHIAPTNLKVPPPTLNVPPPILNETSPTCKKVPATLQLPSLNLQLPPPNLQLPPPQLQLPPPNSTPSCHISPFILPNCSQPPPTAMATSDSLPVVSVPFQQLYDPAHIQTICSDTEQNSKHRLQGPPHSQVKVNNGIESKQNGHSENQTSRTDSRYSHRSRSVACDDVRSSCKRKRCDDISYKDRRASSFEREPRASSFEREWRASSFERGWNRRGGSCNERICSWRYGDTISPLPFDTRSDENSNIVKKTAREEKEQKYPEEGKEGALTCSSKAQDYYDAAEAEGVGGAGRVVRGTRQLAELCDRFERELLLSGRGQREKLPPRDDAGAQRRGCEFSSQSGVSEEKLPYDPARTLEELRCKMSHPRRLHPDIWYNEEGQANSGPTCKCSADARLVGVHHYVYEGEPKFPRCRPDTNNIDKLFYYRLTVSPTTNFLMEAPTVITHDQRDYIFTGFSLISHYELRELPPCMLLRFKIEHTVDYLKGEAPANFTIRELDLFHSYLFKELLQLMDFKDNATDETCSQFHLLPRFVTRMPGGCEVLSMCEVMKYLLNSTVPVLEYNRTHPEDLCREALLWNPEKKPPCIRCDLLDPDELRPAAADENAPPLYPTIVHFGIKPSQICFTLNKEYQDAWKLSKSYYHKITSMAKPTVEDQRLLQMAVRRLSDAKKSSMAKREVTTDVSSEGFYTTGLMSDIVQHAVLIPQLIHHLRFYKSLESLESRLCYRFARPSLLRLALTHPSYRERGANLDHIRNTISNCALSRPTYGHATGAVCGLRRKGIKNLARKMEDRGADAETTPSKNYERLEFLGDAVLQYLTSCRLFLMFPDMDEGELTERRISIVSNENLAVVGKHLGLDKYLLIYHSIDNSEECMSRAISDCVEAVLGAVYVDGGLESVTACKRPLLDIRLSNFPPVLPNFSGTEPLLSADALDVVVPPISDKAADKTLAEMIWGDLDIKETWLKVRVHPLVSEDPRGDRHYIPLYSSLQKLVLFEESINLQFKHIRLLARAFADRTQRESYLTLGSCQRLEFLGDAVLELVVTGKLFRRYPAHTEGQLSLLRGSLVCNERLAIVFDDLAMGNYTITSIANRKPYCLKQKADVVEAFLGAVYLDKGMTYCESVCEVVLMHHLESILENQSWNDAKSKLQHCCIALRTIGSEPELPVYRLLECQGASHERKFIVAVYYRGERLATGAGSSVSRSEAAAAAAALDARPDLFPLLDRNGRIIQRPMTSDDSSETNKNINPTPSTSCSGQEPHGSSQELHVSQQDSHISSQVSRVSSQQRHVRSLENQVSSQEHEISGQENYVSTQEPHISSQECHISSQQPHVSSLEPYVSGSNPQFSSQENISGQDSHIDSQEPHVSSQQHQVSSEESQISSQENHFSSKEPHSSSQESNISGQDSHINSQEPHVNSLKSHVSSQEHQVSSEESQISSQENHFSSQEPHGSSQESNISGQDSHINSQEPHVSSLKSHVSSQEHQVSSEESQISSQENHFSSQEPHGSSQESNISGQDSHINSQEPHVSSLKSHVSSQEHQVSSKESQISSQENHIIGQKMETDSESDDSLDNVVVTSWLTDMRQLKEKMIRNQTYAGLIAKKYNCSDDDDDYN